MEALGEPWRRLGRAGGGLGGVLGGAGAVLEVYKRRLGVVSGALEAMLEPSGSQKASKMEPKATRTDNGETLIFDDSTQDFNDFSGLEAPFWNKKWVQHNHIFDVEGVRKPLDRHLGGYQSALEGILAAPGRILAAIYGPFGGTRAIGKHQAGSDMTKSECRHPP